MTTEHRLDGSVVVLPQGQEPRFGQAGVTVEVWIERPAEPGNRPASHTVVDMPVAPRVGEHLIVGSPESARPTLRVMQSTWIQLEAGRWSLQALCREVAK